MVFSKNKAIQLSRQDKSNEQGIDKAIRQLCEKINKKKEYYTTSSCSGRITLTKSMKEKSNNAFLFKSHEKISFFQLKKALEKVKKEYKNLVYFKQEPCILHVACNNLKSAVSLLNKAKFCGWKKSGIIPGKNRFIIEMLSTEKIEMPIINKGRILVNENYLKLLVKEANRKLMRTRGKIKKLEREI